MNREVSKIIISNGNPQDKKPRHKEFYFRVFIVMCCGLEGSNEVYV